MPIQVKCQCGHILSVADKFAGRTGKCPKCGQAIKIPQSASPTAGSANVAAIPVNKPAQPKTPVPPAPIPTPSSGLGDLLEEAGIVNRGPVCPSCQAPIQRGAKICVACGFDSRTGEKLMAHQTASSMAEFENKHLQEASQMMVREDALQQRTLNAGMPWWAVLCFLLVGVLLAASGVIIVDAIVGRKQPKGTFIGNIQAQPILVVILGVFLIGAALISLFSHWALVFRAYKEKGTQGLLATFIPFYSGIYGLMRFREIRSTTIAFWASLIIGISIAIFLQVRFRLL